MTVAVYARQKDGRLAVYQVPDGMDNADVINAVKQELGVERALLLVSNRKQYEHRNQDHSGQCQPQGCEADDVPA